LLTLRIITAAVLVAATLISVYWPSSWLMALLFGLVWTAGAWEWGRLAGWTRLGVWGYALACALLALAGGGLFDQVGAQQIAWVATAWWVLAFGTVLLYPWRIPVAFVAGAGLLALLPSWFLLVYLHHTGPAGPNAVLVLLVIVWAADVGAYFVGKTFGRVKLAPAVSPGKTWEGVVGGVAAATAAALAAAAVFEQPAGSWIAVGLATALMSIVGDLTVSMFKRRAGKKDSSNLLPGHGGVLDRIDSLTAAVPVYFLATHLAGLSV
jgi:phosphatidate cytidylyltransferase